MPSARDVAQFLVGAPSLRVEPGRWTAVGVNTNFIAGDAEQREVTGQLLGQPVRVRFSPVAYHWEYGDGGARTTSVPGADWHSLGVGELASTPTSHVYSTRGQYSARVTVGFVAAYQFADQPWAPIEGQLGLTSEPVTVTVKGVKTMLVGHDCNERPSGPGCED